MGTRKKLGVNYWCYRINDYFSPPPTVKCLGLKKMVYILPWIFLWKHRSRCPWSGLVWEYRWKKSSSSITPHWTNEVNGSSLNAAGQPAAHVREFSSVLGTNSLFSCHWPSLKVL